ncbi:MAG: exo-alpha-sialidase [Akkermansiaceae bacterium]|nr:exo-alpha-sialidase [Akkermansiaceae bacterium]
MVLPTDFISSRNRGWPGRRLRLAVPFVAALCCWLAFAGGAASAAPGDDWIDSTAAGETFDGFPVAAISMLDGHYGSFTASSGDAEIVDMSSRGFGRSLKINGSGGGTAARSVTLHFPSPLEEESPCAFRAERWTSSQALAFRVYYLDSTGGRTLLVDAGSAQVSNNGSTPFPSSFRGTVPAGAQGLVFECTAGSAVMVDNLLLGTDAGAQVSILAKNWPVMKNLDMNGVLRFKLSETPSSYADMSVIVDLSGSTALEDVESVSVCIPPSGFDDGWETLAGGVSAGTVLGTSSVSADGTARVAVDGAGLMAGTAYSFWISVKMKGSASLDDRVKVKLAGVSVGNSSLMVPDVPAASQRIGYAVAKSGDVITGGKQEGRTSSYFRIPGIVRAKNGDLVAVYDIRYNSGTDLPAVIDVGVARSSDGGETWTRTAVAMDWDAVMEPEGSGYNSRWGIGDPAILVDENTGTLWLAAIAGTGLSGSASTNDVESSSTSQLVTAFSTDHGATWSECRSINSQVRSTTATWQSIFQGPGHGITVQGGEHDGTLVFPAQIWHNGMGIAQSCIIYSKDHGKTWVCEEKYKNVTAGNYGIGTKTSECSVAQLSDGSLMLNAKDENNSKYRAVYTTADLGKTWTQHETDRKAARTLMEPKCQGSLFSVLEAGRMRHVLFFSNPTSSTARREMTLKTSLDDGKTWPAGRQIQYDSRQCAGYSDVCLVDEDHVGILYEGLQASAHIFFLKIPVSEVLSVLSVDTADISVSAEGIAVARLAVTCDSSWTALSSADWLVLSGASGDGDGNVVYSAAPFGDVGTREAVISVSSPGLKPVSIRVVQTGRAATLIVAPEEVVLGKGVSAATLSVSCNAGWTAAKDAAWLVIESVEGTDGNGTISISAEANGGASTRTATLTVSSFLASRDVVVRQRGGKLTWNEWKKDKITGRDPSNSETGPGQSAAGDGVPNLLKYATGMDPLKPGGSPVRISEKDNRLLMTWPVNEDAVGISLRVEASSNLKDWTESYEVTVPGEFHDAPEIGAGGAERRFLRLAVTLDADGE